MPLDATTALLLIHAAASCFMAGLIWFVQVVHYPLLASVDSASFPDYHRRHASRTTFVVAPVMLVELAAASTIAWLSWRNSASSDAPSAIDASMVQPAVDPVLSVLGLAALAVCWLSTFLVMVPLHNRLGASRDDATLRRLVLFNWPRTIAWTLRAAVSIAMLAPPFDSRSAAP